MAVTLDLTQVLLAIVTALSAIGLAYVTRLNGKTAAVESKLDIVEKTVNTNYQAMTRDLKISNDLLADAALQIATLTEKARGADIATARSQGLSEGILLPSPGSSPPPTVSVINGGHVPAPVPVEVVATVPVPVATETERTGSPESVPLPHVVPTPLTPPKPPP